MRVTEINDGQKADWAVEETDLTITVGEQSITIDLDAAQTDTERIVTIALDEKAQLMLETGQWYVASVIVPPIRTRLVDTGQLDESGNPQMIQEVAPLSANDVSMVLWALPLITNTNEEGGTL